MTKLEEEMFFAIHGFSLPSDPELANLEINDLLKEEAKAAAEVAKRYIEKAMEAQTRLCALSLGLSSAVWSYPQDYLKIKEWIEHTPIDIAYLKENGIIEAPTPKF